MTVATLRRARPGFALLTVLWVTVVLAIVGIAATVEARDGLHASRNRAWLERASWRASGCLSLALSVVAEVLATAPDHLTRDDRWRSLANRVVLHDQVIPADCSVTLAADGDALSVNGTSERGLVAYFEATGLGPDRLDLAQAVLDWRDEDDIPRPHGVERAWYRSEGRIEPRNGPFGDPAEVRLVRGLESITPGQIAGLSTIDARVSVNTAPREVLATVPGFGPELIDRLTERAARGEPVHDLLALERLVAGEAAEQIRAHFPQIVQAATVSPEAWRLTAVVRAGAPEVTVTLEARLIRSGISIEVSHWRMQ